MSYHLLNSMFLHKTYDSSITITLCYYPHLLLRLRMAKQITTDFLTWRWLYIQGYAKEFTKGIKATKETAQ